MNKQEIEHKLEQARKEERAIGDNIIKLLEQLAEAEKPKLGHGDFGINEEGNGRVALFRHGMTSKGENIGERDDFGRMGIHTDSEVIPFGNIFDLMDDWGEDLEHFELDVNHYSINPIDFPHAPIHIAGNWHTEAEAYKFWCDFGQMLMTHKRKQS